MIKKTCDCGGKLVLATKQIVTGGPRYPLRDRATGKLLRVCEACGRVCPPRAEERSGG